jgi:hypothetical protein
VPMYATPDQITKAEALRKTAEARRLGLPAAAAEPAETTSSDRIAALEKLVEDLHWQLHCERRRADAATARAARSTRALFQDRELRRLIAQAEKLDVCGSRTDRA